MMGDLDIEDLGERERQRRDREQEGEEGKICEGE